MFQCLYISMYVYASVLNTSVSISQCMNISVYEMCQLMLMFAYLNAYVCQSMYKSMCVYINVCTCIYQCMYMSMYEYPSV